MPLNYNTTFVPCVIAIERLADEPIQAQTIDHGLVLHYALGRDGQPHPEHGYGISDPDTGTCVVWGADLEQVMAHLSEQVDFFGGPEGFDVALHLARQHVKSRRAAHAQRIAETQAVMADVHRVLAPETLQ